VLPDRSAPANAMTANQPTRSLGTARTSSPICMVEEDGEIAMISPETQTSRLLRKTAELLNSVAEAAWTADTASPIKWDLHRIGTEAYLAQRDILDALGQDAEPSETLPGIDIAAALEEAVHTLAAIRQELFNLDPERLEARVSSLARWAVALTPSPIRTGR
jgi:hypothetical protein